MKKTRFVSSDPELQLRGRLVRSLGALRKMLPGSFVERRRRCGRPNCRCADGQHLHSQYQLSVLAEGKLKTYNVPAAQAELVRHRVGLHRRFEKAAAMISALNLRRWLRQSKPREQ
ncbi:conserved hypothetical protein [Acidobacteriia bacterium SbA2]|nr:conserved hypothetical protein [Acidobacteriia bacterium SbA2]